LLKPFRALIIVKLSSGLGAQQREVNLPEIV
jgi:hypothetical protein